MKTTSYKIILSVILALLSSSCTPYVSKMKETKNYSQLALYGANNNLLCRLLVVYGHYSFYPGAACPNDKAYYFSVENPREGVIFSITESYANLHSCSGAGAEYQIIDPIPGQPTARVPVGAAFTVPEGKEIVPGVVARRWYGANRPIEGKVSCVVMWRDGH
ncbi:hypothetical protein [Pseudomonas sp. GM80]|uniref:hypothetical protein n=1 Tax=Pseudomonas sp. GM80 TaxID=1144339 RepID=UPI0012F6578D|nr:hypothetical protein [Pseudomonas sp. GM80]